MDFTMEGASATKQGNGVFARTSVGNGTCMTDAKPQRFTKLAKILARQDPKIVNKAFNTYLRELTDLLENGDEGKMVAYVKGKRVAIAPTPEALTETLRDQKLEHADGLFIRRVTETDAVDYSINR